MKDPRRETDKGSHAGDIDEVFFFRASAVKLSKFIFVSSPLNVSVTLT